MSTPGIDLFSDEGRTYISKEHGGGGKKMIGMKYPCEDQSVQVGKNIVVSYK